MDQTLAQLWRSIESAVPTDHTSIVVPSLSFDTEEIAKISGAPFYEERLLFSLMRLRDPRARVIYVTSQPLHPEIIDYYLGLLVGVSPRSARSRLRLFCCYDGRSVPLTEKILERPRLIERIRREMGDPNRTYLTCFNSTVLEKNLAQKLGIALNGCDPDLLDLGSKSGSREIFKGAEVPRPRGRERLQTVADIVEALGQIWQPGLKQAVIKLDQSFAGAGNALFTYPSPLSDDPQVRRQDLQNALHHLRFTEPSTVEAFLSKFESMGGVVEEMVTGEEIRSPSVQMRITPTQDLEIVSTHDQILGGQTGQSYSGCRFPADPAYRQIIQNHALKVGKALRERGVISRFAVDFVVARDQEANWRVWAIEINLRMGGTTTPFIALQFLTGGQLDAASGEFIAPDGRKKYYRSTDSLKALHYRGLLLEDLMDLVDENSLGFSSQTSTGVLFHMMGALSEHGKVGVTAIGDSASEADSFFQQVVVVLDHATRGNEAVVEAQPLPTTSARLLPME